MALKTAPYDIDWEQVERLSQSRADEDWRPVFDERPLGKRGPVDWSRGHYTTHPGRFEPAKASGNIVRLVNRSIDQPEQADDCYRMAWEYIDLAVSSSFMHRGARFISRPYPHRGNSGGWVNSLSNGFFLSALSHMQKHRPCPKIGRLLDELAQAFLRVNNSRRQLDRPWFVWWDKGYLWFDEYPMDDSTPTLVLNGHIHSLYGIMAYHTVSPKDWTSAYIQAGLYTMRRHAKLFRRPKRINFYAINDQRRDYAPARTARQQRELYRITGDPFFKTMAEIFEQDYLKDPRLAKVVAGNLAAKKDPSEVIRPPVPADAS